MKSSIRAILLSVGVAVVASCGGEPSDKTLQADDYPGHGKPDFSLKPIQRLAPVKERTFGQCSPAEVQSLVGKQPRPEMMALGGSVFNGISSMQINWWLADWSPPAQVARALAGELRDEPVPGLKVPAYPDYGRDPYGQPRRQAHTFRLGLDLETITATLIETGVRRQGRLMNEFRSYSSMRDPLAERRHAFNDNLGFGGAAIDDLLYGTARDYRLRLDATRRSTSFPPDRDDFWGKVERPRTYGDILEHAQYVNGVSDVAKTVGSLTTVFFAQNSSFVLNPTQHQCIEHMTPLDQALLRQPKRLLVGVGSNSGLMTFLYSGQRVDDVCGDVSFTYNDDKVQEWKRYVSIRQSSDDEFLAGMDRLLDKLAKEGASIEHVYVMGQLKPSVIANMEPRPGLGVPGEYPPHQAKFPPAGYYAEYKAAFAPDDSRRILGKDLKEADELNDLVNRKLKFMVEERNRASAKTRFIFVDLSAFEKYDHKHYDVRPDVRKHFDRDDMQVVVTKEHLPGLNGKVRIDNRPLVFLPLKQHLDQGVAGQQIVQGGIFSLDNLHPSPVGYALLARELARKIEEVEKRPGIADRISPEMAYARQFKKTVNGEQVDNHGNVLRRVDPSLAWRTTFLSAILDFTSNGRLDCLARPGDEP